MDQDESWELRANCRGKAFELFEYQEIDSPLTEGMKYNDRVAFNGANFDLAAEICIECPVMLICGETATDEEKYWTVRGGEPPGRFYMESKRYANVGKPKGSKNKKHKNRDASGQFISNPDRVCKRGHHVKGGGRCMECRRAANAAWLRAYRAKQRDGVE